MFTVDRSSIKRLWRVDGKKSNTLLGALIGLPAGTLAGIIVVSLTCDAEFSELCTLVGAAIGAGVGVISGGLIGLNKKSDRWVEVDAKRVSLSVGMVRTNLSGFCLVWFF